jgi:hypothetical protein
VEVAVALVVLAGVWVGSFLALGALTAFRSIAWTFELARRGTIGASRQDLTGDWAAGDSSGRL